MVVKSKAPNPTPNAPFKVQAFSEFFRKLCPELIIALGIILEKLPRKYYEIIHVGSMCLVNLYLHVI